MFDVFKLDTDAFAASLGLAVPPRVRFLQKQLKLREEAKNKKVKAGTGSNDETDDGGKPEDANGDEAPVKKEKKITLAIDSGGNTKLLSAFMV